MLKRYLMTPGPTTVPPQVLESQARPMIHHRTPDFSATVRSCAEGLKQVFETTESDVLMFSSSGTGAMESAITNCFCAGDTIIVTHNGKFGQRMVQISQAYGLDVIELGFPWREVVDPAIVEQALRDNPHARGVVVTQSETSSGVLNDVEAIGKIVHEYENCVFIVDSITGIGAVPCKTDEWHLDVVMTGSQKGLMLPPGLAAVAVSPKAWKAYERSTLPKFYFDWKKYKKSLGDDTTPFTPAVSLLNGLKVALDMIVDEGVDQVVARHELNARAVREGLVALGLELFAPEAGRGSAVTPVCVPEGIDGTQIVKIMKERYGITVAGGQDAYKGKIVRIGHLGYVGEFDVIGCLAALEMTLADLGYEFERGSGVKAAEEVYMEVHHD